MAGKSTLNRLELSETMATRYHKISHDPAAIKSLFVTLFLEAHKTPPAEIRSISTPPTIHCTGIKRGGSSTAIAVTAIYRCTLSVAGICWRRSSARRTSMHLRAA